MQRTDGFEREMLDFRAPCFPNGLESEAMPKFKVGDRVERIGTLVPTYMKNGIITQVIPNEYGIEWFTQYEVNFGSTMIATFYETQLKPAQDDPQKRS
jgi:hypothetical protein